MIIEKYKIMQNLNYNKHIFFNLIMNNFNLKHKIKIYKMINYLYILKYFMDFKCTKSHLYETKCQDVYMSLYMLTVNNIYSFSL